ncbi:hypothetical protein MMYC01_201749 [Madurella mycetomatis]|uniref:Uncharacterized protein n=1 Tax=Madurella mycetomatis TaxID=100816 RepID=A0A175WCL8_9PEZI|nr:hypothetical protein MMYC01_201749 [Madurella mycetomatis]
MPGGLANSRHAPWPRQSTARGITNPGRSHLTVTPAPIDGDRDSSSLLPPPAPAQPITSSSDSRTRKDPPSHAKHELARYTKIIRRLQWKLPFLAQGYNLAVDRLGKDPTVVSEAELMFKLDFFEYYMLIERALVHLLGVFGVDVPRGHQSPTAPAPDGNGRAAEGLAASTWKNRPHHRYHANVLAALDREDNPLHETLGTGDVRQRLGRAKDLRNRWKTVADDDDEGPGGGDKRDTSPAGPERGWHTKKIASPLETYDLEKMLEVIFRGFDDAYRVAERFVRGGADHEGGIDMDMAGEVVQVVDGGAGELDQWEFMVDAMDWEAV